MRRAIRLLNLRRLASVRLRMVIAVVAVAAGSSLALSVIIVESSASYSLHRLNQQVAGSAELRVVGATSTGGLNFRALAAVASTPGVKEAVPIVQAISDVRTNGTHNQAVLVLGVNCGASQLVGGATCAGAAGESSANPAFYVARSLQRKLTRASWLETNQGIIPMARTTALASLDSVDRGDVVVMPLARAQQLFVRMGRVDDIYVIPTPSTSIAALQHRLQRALGPWDGVVGATSAPPGVSLALNAFTPVLALLALVASAIAVVLVYNVISLTIEERRREHAIVAAVGAPLSVLIVGPLIEAGVLGAVGGLLGALGGIVLARPIVGTLSNLTLGLVGIPVTLHTTPATFVIGLIIGVVIGLLAAVRPVRRAMRADIAAEIAGREQRERTSSRANLRSALAFTAVAGGGGVVSWLGARNGSLQSWQPDAALLGLVIVLVFSVLALGSWAPVVVRALSRRVRFGGGAIRLGLANLVREPARTGVMAIAIGAAVSVGFITGSYDHAIDQDIATGFTQSPEAHSVAVSTVAGADGYNIDGQIPPAVLSALSRLPGVTSVVTFDGELTGYTTGQLTLVESSSRTAFDLAVFSGQADPAAFARGEVLVGANLARRDHLSPGSRLHLDTPTGIASVVVQGIWNDGNAGGDDVTMPMSLEHRLFGAQVPSYASLLVAGDRSTSSVVAEARAAHLGPYLKYATPSKQLSDADQSISGEFAPFLVLQRALLLVSFISVLSTLMLVGIQRRREFGLLGAVGMTPKELFRMVVAEAFTVGVIAVVLGAALGSLLLESLLDVTPLLGGYHDTYSPDVASLLVYGPISVLVAVVASLWPGRQAARTPILEALTYE